MKLNYPTSPAPGTIVGHVELEKGQGKRFIAVDFSVFSIDEQQRPRVSTALLREADQRGEIYPISQGGYEPRSVVEHYILRCKWTPYGYAKVFGSTPNCPPPVRPSPVPRTPEEKPRTKKQIMEDVYRGQARCKAWWDERRPPEVIKDWSWLREGKRLYNKANG